MSKFLTASIGRKFLLSITGLFLLMFIGVHLLLNLMLIFDNSGELYNLGVHFMATNPAIKIMEPVLGLGFLIHILWSVYLEYLNWRARPIKYNKLNRKDSSTWGSRNMLLLGALIFVFLAIHIINFFWVIKFNPHSMQTVTINGVEMEDAFALVSGLFTGSFKYLYSILYIIGAVLLAIKLAHGFWSGFHTLGMNNTNWMKRLKFLANIYAIIVGVGFSAIPLYFLFIY